MAKAVAGGVGYGRWFDGQGVHKIPHITNFVISSAIYASLVPLIILITTLRHLLLIVITDIGCNH